VVHLAPSKIPTHPALHHPHGRVPPLVISPPLAPKVPIPQSLYIPRSLVQLPEPQLIETLDELDALPPVALVLHIDTLTVAFVVQSNSYGGTFDGMEVGHSSVPAPAVPLLYEAC
jgi:hypothetical protein